MEYIECRWVDGKRNGQSCAQELNQHLAPLWLDFLFPTSDAADRIDGEGFVFGCICHV